MSTTVACPLGATGPFAKKLHCSAKNPAAAKRPAAALFDVIDPVTERVLTTVAEADVTVSEAEMIDKIFDLGETAVREVMVPLVDVAALADAHAIGAHGRSGRLDAHRDWIWAIRPRIVLRLRCADSWA